MKVYPIFDKNKQNMIEKYLELHNKRNHLLWILGTHTGLRISDILRLKVGDIKQDRIVVKEQKTGKTKTAVLSGKLRAVFSEYLLHNKLKNDDIIFRSRQSKDRPMTVRRVQQIVKNIGKITEIKENINTHTMRKTFAYNLYKLSGNNIALVMETLNHARESVTLRYLCVRELMLTELVELL